MNSTDIDRIIDEMAIKIGVLEKDKIILMVQLDSALKKIEEMESVEDVGLDKQDNSIQ